MEHIFVSRKNYSILVGFLFLYVAISIYGVAWVSDEFDGLRNQMYSVGFPLTILLFVFGYEKIFSWEKFRKRFFLFLFLFFSWGHFLLFNALLGEKPTQVRVTQQTDEQKMAFSYQLKRGGLGSLYRTRW